MGAGRGHDESAARLAAVAAITDEALIATDEQGTIYEWSAAAERLFGYSATDVLGRPFSAIVSLPDTHDDLSRAIDVSARRKDGGSMAMSLSIAPIRGAHGEPAGAVYVARDPRQKLATSRGETPAAIVESSDDAIVSKDLNGIVVVECRGAAMFETPPTKSSAGRSEYRSTTGKAKRTRCWRASAAAIVSITSRPFGNARTARSSRSR
jgi:PAS domain S-box-containing protein